VGILSSCLLALCSMISCSGEIAMYVLVSVQPKKAFSFSEQLVADCS
jgi:hypothetical protein